MPDMKLPPGATLADDNPAPIALPPGATLDTGSPNPPAGGYLHSLEAQLPGSAGRAALLAGSIVSPVAATAMGFGAGIGHESNPQGERDAAAYLHEKGKAAVDAFHRGDYLGAARQTQNALLHSTGFEEPVGKIEDQIGSGDYSGAAGSAMGFLGQFALAHGLGKLGDMASGAIQGGAGKVNPVRNITKALRPTSANTDFQETAPGALEDIKSMAGDKPIQNNEDFRAAAQRYLDHNRTVMNAWEAIPHSIGATADGAPIGQAMLAAFGKMAGLEDPEALAALKTKAGKYDGPIKLSDLKNYHEEGNKRMNGFYSAAPDKQAAQLGAGLNPAIEEGKLSAIRDIRYKGLDPEGDGAGPREVQSRYGAVADLLNAATKRRNSILAEGPETPFAGLKKDVLSHTRLVSHAGDFPQDSDALIRRAMAEVGPASPHPVPADSRIIKGYLTAPAMGMPSAPDASYVSATGSPAGYPVQQRQLGAGQTIFTEPPDASGVHGVPAPPPGFRVGFPADAPKQLPAPVGPRNATWRDAPLGGPHGDVVGPGVATREFIQNLLFPKKK